jgi:hypothetical protein
VFFIPIRHPQLREGRPIGNAKFTPFGRRHQGRRPGKIATLVPQLVDTGLPQMTASQRRKRKRLAARAAECAKPPAAPALPVPDDRARHLVRNAFLLGLGCLLIGLPGLVVCGIANRRGEEIPQVATFIAMPAAGFPGVCWFYGTFTGVVQWLQGRRPSRWVAYSALGLILYAFVWVGFLRASQPRAKIKPLTAPVSRNVSQRVTN